MISNEQIVEALKKVVDPELGIDIYTLGLIYGITPDPEKPIIQLTLTSPMCPYGPQVISDVKQKVGALPGVKEVIVDLTFEPPWQPSEDVKLMLGIVM
ncbi:MAG: metal-sulfur cluster assembly factor [Candidatus Nanoarchaeia archaeon]